MKGNAVAGIIMERQREMEIRRSPINAAGMGTVMITGKRSTIMVDAGMQGVIMRREENGEHQAWWYPGYVWCWRWDWNGADGGRRGL